MKKKDKGKWDLEPQKSSAAQYLTYIAAYGISDEKFEIRYEDESIWMSQKMLAAVYGIEVNSVNYHIKKIFADAELDENSVIRKIRITGSDGKNYLVNHYNLKVIIAIWDGPVTVEQVENVTAAIAQDHAESEFEKYRPLQDKLFLSDYDRYLLALEEEAKNARGEEGNGV